MHEIGISIYPEKLGIDKTLDYIKSAKQHGCKRLYATYLQAIINPLQAQHIFAIYKTCFKLAKELGYEITVDVNQKIFNVLKQKDYDLTFFYQQRIDVIRFDVVLKSEEIAELTYNKYGIKIELQMSNDDKLLDHLMTFQPKKSHLQGSHNFYPQAYTGLSWEMFRSTSKVFLDYNLKTTAYISSANHLAVGPWPTSDGLVTIEQLRYCSLEVQAQALWQTKMVNDLLIANAFCLESEFKLLKMVDPYIINLKVKLEKTINKLEKTIVLNEKHFCRPDVNEFLIRSTQSRVKYINDSNKQNNTISDHFYKGDILIGNDQAGLYKNELQIVSQTIKNDGSKNLVGKIDPGYLLLIDFIKPNTKFKFYI